MTVTGYGIETSCTTGYQAGRLVSGWRIVAQALFRRITTPRGTLNDGEDGERYGVDISEYIGANSTDRSVIDLPQIVAAEWGKDDRVSSVSMRAFYATASDGTTTITLEGEVTLHEEGQRFTFSIAAVDGDVGELFAEAA